MGHEFSGRVLDYGPQHAQGLGDRHAGGVAADDPDGREGADDRPVGQGAGRVRRAGARPGVAHHGRAQRSLPRDGRPHRADGGRLARRTPQRGAQEGDRGRHRLRSDRPGRDPDAQGTRREAGGRQRLLARAPRARRAVRRRRRGRPRRRGAVDRLREEPLHHRRQRPVRPRARHDGQAAQGPEAAVVAGAARRRGRRGHSARAGGLRVRRSARDHRPDHQRVAAGVAGRRGRRVHGAGHLPAGDGDQQGDRPAVRVRLPAARVPRGPAPDRRRQGRPDPAHHRHGRPRRRRRPPSTHSATPSSTPRS